MYIKHMGACSSTDACHTPEFSESHCTNSMSARRARTGILHDACLW
jgi:hypothetical protein